MIQSLKKDLFWYCIRLVVSGRYQLTKIAFFEDSWGSILDRWFPSYFPQHILFAQVKQLQELLELKQVKLNRCTAELQALGRGRRVSIRHIALDPMVQALQKFQSTSMTSSSPLALGGCQTVFFEPSFFLNFPEVTRIVGFNNPGF